MKLQNRTQNGLSHILETVDKEGKVTKKLYFIAAGDYGEVPKEVADIWLKIKGVCPYVEAEDLAKAEAEAKAKQEALEKENEALKKKLEAAEKAKAKKK